MRLPLPLAQLKKVLTAENLITPERFDELTAEADRKNQSIMDVLVAQNVVTSAYLAETLAKMLGVSRVDFSSRSIDRDVLVLLDEATARQRQVILFGREPNGLYDAAMVDPSDLETIEFLEQRLAAKIKPFLATADDLNRGFSVYGYESGKDFQKLLEENIQESLRHTTKTVEEAAATLPIVAIVDNILSYAVASRASDIHIEALEDAMLVRYRIDGILYEIINVTRAINPAVVARIKLLGGLKIDEHLKPQDGRLLHSIVYQAVDIRVSVIPTYYGEKVVMRLLEASQKPLSLEEVGMSSRDAQTASENLKSTYGMIVVCGPTGSGKTTTLYALMNMLNKPQVNIVTVEDPIEYNMKYVNQTQINPTAGITFASGLRAILRQDPNVVMVGEIRDAETAGIAVQAALTGQLVLSSIHTNDAPTAVPRLFDLKVPPFLISSVLMLLIAQRLVRKLCANCAYSYEPGPELKKIIAGQLQEIGSKIQTAPKLFYRGKGCPQCGMTGYKGRIGIFELIETNEKIRQIVIDQNFSLAALRGEARSEGRNTMFEDGLEKVELALTTIEEVLRVIRE